MSTPFKILLIFALISGCLAVVVLAALALLPIRDITRRKHRTSAIATLFTFNRIESEYNVKYPDNGFACSLATLGGNPQAGPPTAEAAQLIPADLASGKKAGYIFSIANCTKKIVKGKTQFIGYQIFAVPAIVGHTGDYGFCTDENTEIRFDPKGGTNCTELLQ